WRKRPQRLPIQLVGIRDFSDTTHGQLRRQAERLAHRLIGQLVDGELAERLSRKSNLTTVVARGIDRLKRAPECVSLHRRRLQFQLHAELHLASLVLLNVVLDRFPRNVTGSADIVRTTPQPGQTGRQMWKRITQDTRGVALELIGKLL